MTTASLCIDSPVGRLLMVGEQGALIAVAPAPHGAKSTVGTPVLRKAAAQIAQYFEGSRATFDLPIRLRGTPFQCAVWNALLEIPFGETRTYAQQAGKIGRPRATRAVGAANGRNPLFIIVPCHRVIGSDGSLTGFGAGLPAKRWLLDHERRMAADGVARAR